MEDKIITYIRKNYFDTKLMSNSSIKRGDIVVIALSGGMDSMCLFDIFYKLSIDYGYKLIALHIHHGIRGKEADNDLFFVRRYCKNFQVEIIEKQVKAKEYAKENSLTLEEAARILRYREFENVWKELSSKYVNNNIFILLAHHLKDQVETIIHNMLRGTGIKGLAGMNDKRENFIRPLLYVSKDEIENYVKEYAIPYVVDSTNLDENYTRNYIRNEIIDKFEKVNLKAFEHILELSKQAREMNDYIENLCNNLYKDMLVLEDKGYRIIINSQIIKKQPHLIKVGIIRIVINRLVSTLKDVTRINIEDVIKLIDKENGGHLDLPYNITIDKKQKQLIFVRNNINISMNKRRKK